MAACLSPPAALRPAHRNGSGPGLCADPGEPAPPNTHKPPTCRHAHACAAANRQQTLLRSVSMCSSALCAAARGRLQGAGAALALGRFLPADAGVTDANAAAPLPLAPPLRSRCWRGMALCRSTGLSSPPLSCGGWIQTRTGGWEGAGRGPKLWGSFGPLGCPRGGARLPRGGAQLPHGAPSYRLRFGVAPPSS
jgi:hypothetical protein